MSHHDHHEHHPDHEMKHHFKHWMRGAMRSPLSGPCAVGKPAPDFDMECVLPQSAGDGPARFGRITLEEIKNAGKWTVLYFYPRDFTFICPTEIRSFNQHYDKFKALNAEVVAVSTDSTFTHLKWQETDLGMLDHPHGADPSGRVSFAYGVLVPEDGLALRGTFIISPDGTLYSYSINHDGVGRSVEEVLRLLEASQAAAAGKLMPCEWHPGEKALND